MTTTTALRLPTPVPQRTVRAAPDWRLDPTRQYDQQGHTLTGHKPHGLWYGFGASWADWCRANDYGIPTYVLHPLHLANPAAVLTLRTDDDYAAFVREYSDPTRAFTPNSSLGTIRWGVVAALWAGLELPTFDHGRSMDAPATHGWSYGWDCASGCVWDLVAAEVLSTPAMLPPWKR